MTASAPRNPESSVRAVSCDRAALERLVERRDLTPSSRMRAALSLLAHHLSEGDYDRARQLAETSLEAVGGPPPAPETPTHELWLDRTDRAFALDGRRVSLRRRRAPWLILERLAQARAERPSSGVSVEELVEAGWPGERIDPDAAAGRVYFVIRQLRTMGLEGVLITNGEGYAIDPRCQLVVDDCHAA